MHKKELLRPIKPLPLEVPGNSQNYELPKKGSKKLVIKVNDKKNEENSDKKKEQERRIINEEEHKVINVVEKVPESESVVVNEVKVKR